MSTPIRHPWARHRNSLGLTQSAVAEQLGVSRHMVTRLEQSLFQEPPFPLLTKLALLFDQPPDLLLTEYHLYVEDTRTAFKEKHRSFETILKNYVGLLHPLSYYRDMESLSKIGFCIELCVHIGPINDYEKNVQRKIPKQLATACLDMGWEYSPLEQAVARWRIAWR